MNPGGQATWATGTAALLAAAQVLLVAGLAPVLMGVMRQARSRLEGRAGAGVLQPWRDLRKLLAKEAMRAAGGGPVLRWAPLVVMGSALMVAALVPLVATSQLAVLPGDLFVVVSVLLVGTVAVALLGLEHATAFGGMGSSRHMTLAALVEPTVLVSVYALSIPVGTSALAVIVAARVDDPASVVSPGGVLAVVALAIAVIAETGRLPVDNPATHLELTMIHEAMVLESAGRDLAWLEWGSWVRLTALLGLVVNLAVPWGIVTDPGGTGPAGLGLVVVAVLAVVVKVLLAGAAVATAEVAVAKLRLFRVPELLAGSFLLAFLAVTASSLVG